jgi:hypothetical protein
MTTPANRAAMSLRIRVIRAPDRGIECLLNHGQEAMIGKGPDCHVHAFHKMPQARRIPGRIVTHRILR